MRHGVRQAVLLACLLLASAASMATGKQVGPTGVRHLPPSLATMHEALPVSVGLEGAHSAGALVMLYYRPQGARGFSSLRLDEKEEGQFSGLVPAAEMRSLSLAYYIEATGPEEAWRLGLGSPEEPIRVELMEPETQAGQSLVARAGIALVPMLLLAALLSLKGRAQERRQARRERLVKDQDFWVRTLLPVVHLQGAELTAAINRLAGGPLLHPVLGPKRYRKETILRKLKEVRRSDLARATRPRGLRTEPEVQKRRQPPNANDQKAAARAARPSAECKETSSPIGGREIIFAPPKPRQRKATVDEGVKVKVGQ